MDTVRGRERKESNKQRAKNEAHKKKTQSALFPLHPSSPSPLDPLKKKEKRKKEQPANSKQARRYIVNPTPLKAKPDRSNRSDKAREDNAREESEDGWDGVEKRREEKRLEES